MGSRLLLRGRHHRCDPRGLGGACQAGACGLCRRVRLPPASGRVGERPCIPPPEEELPLCGRAAPFPKREMSGPVSPARLRVRSPTARESALSQAQIVTDSTQREEPTPGFEPGTPSLRGRRAIHGCLPLCCSRAIRGRYGRVTLRLFSDALLPTPCPLPSGQMTAAPDARAHARKANRGIYANSLCDTRQRA
jgi:hypothetical protein